MGAAIKPGQSGPTLLGAGERLEARLDAIFQETLAVLGEAKGRTLWEAIAKRARRGPAHAIRDAELLASFDRGMAVVPGATAAVIVADIAKRASTILPSCKNSQPEAIAKALRRAIKVRADREATTARGEATYIKALWGDEMAPASILGAVSSDK